MPQLMPIIQWHMSMSNILASIISIVTITIVVNDQDRMISLNKINFPP